MDNGAEAYRRFLGGDKEALVSIICDYRDGLILYINSLVKDICVAEELAEDTFVKLVVKKPRFSEKSSFKTWLYAIGRHTAADYLRKRSRKKQLSIDELYDCSDEQSLEKSYIREEEKIMLHHTLQQLHTDYSQVLYLVYFEDFTNEEAAGIMHKSKRQIENLLYRAKKALRHELEKEGFRYEGLS